MKRFVMLAALLCLFVAAFADANPHLVVKQVKWRTSANNRDGYVDSLTCSSNGALQTIDTTAVIHLTDLPASAGFHGGAINTTPFTGFKVHFSTASTAANANFDTLFVVPEAVMPDGTVLSNPDANFDIVAAYFLTAADGDDAVNGNILFDSNQDINVSGFLWGIPSFRLRVRVDGDTGVLLAPLKCWISYWVEDDIYR